MNENNRKGVECSVGAEISTRNSDSRSKLTYFTTPELEICHSVFKSRNYIFSVLRADNHKRVFFRFL